MPLGSSVDSARGSDGFDWNAGSSFPQSRRSSTDEGAFYQAEAAMLSRENQMLRQRIRELGELLSIGMERLGRMGNILINDVGQNVKSTI